MAQGCCVKDHYGLCKENPNFILAKSGADFLSRMVIGNPCSASVAQDDDDEDKDAKSAALGTIVMLLAPDGRSAVFLQLAWQILRPVFEVHEVICISRQMAVVRHQEVGCRCCVCSCCF